MYPCRLVKLPIPSPSESSNTTKDNANQVLHSDRICTLSDRFMNPVSRRTSFHCILSIEDRTGNIRCSKLVQAIPCCITCFCAQMTGSGWQRSEWTWNRNNCDNKGYIKVLLSPNLLELTDINNAETDFVTAIRCLLPKFQDLCLEHI